MAQRYNTEFILFYKTVLSTILEKYINEFLSIDNPTRELIINLVEKIYIYQDKTIDIIFTFKNVT